MLKDFCYQTLASHFKSRGKHMVNQPYLCYIKSTYERQLLWIHKFQQLGRDMQRLKLHFQARLNLGPGFNFIIWGSETHQTMRASHSTHTSKVPNNTHIHTHTTFWAVHKKTARLVESLFSTTSPEPLLLLWVPDDWRFTEPKGPASRLG